MLKAGGVAIAAALGWRVERADAATCRPDGAICRKGGDCCTEFCGPKDRTGRQRCGCDGDLVPVNGTCCSPANVCGDVCLDAPCGLGLTCCASEGACVDLLTDPQHCGACDTPIDTDRGEVCCSGDICNAQDICTPNPTNTSMSYCQAQPTGTGTNTATATNSSLT
jgi:hypothetical protein